MTHTSQIFIFPESKPSSVCPPHPSSRRPSYIRQDLQKLNRPEISNSSRIGSNVRSNRLATTYQISESSTVPKKKEKEKNWKEKMEEEEGGMDAIPIVAGVLIATVLGAPVILIAGLKLGMFAAIGGGAMGYTTGKMFSESG